MAFPKFVFDGKEALFPRELSRYDARRKTVAATSFSASGRASTVFEHAFDEVEIVLDSFAERSFFHALQAWWAWAKQGKEYAFALDGDDTAEVFLSGDAGAGESVLPLASTNGIVPGRTYRLRAADGGSEEIIAVASVAEGVSATTASPLLFAYAAGDALRSVDFYPKVISLDEKFPAEEKPFLVFEFKHKFREVK